jgi:hypothetical protein
MTGTTIKRLHPIDLLAFSDDEIGALRAERDSKKAA